MVLTFPPNLPLRKGGYKYSANLGSRSCHIVTDYRTLIDDLWRIIEFADWLHDEALEISPSAENVYSLNCEQEEGP